jgi:uncharacterized protein
MNMTVTASKPTPAKPKRRSGGSFKGELYRQSRAWHGWLSAFAFLALMFFAVTGLLLNHPEWFTPKSDDKPAEWTITLSKPDLARAQAAADPARALAEAVGRERKLRGAYQSGEIIDGEAMIRLEGVTGSSDLIVDLTTGAAEATVSRADLVTTMNELHRGKNAGAAWKAVIDISAIVILALSLIGYVLFFSLRFRLRTSLILTGASLGVLAAVFFLFVP